VSFKTIIDFTNTDLTFGVTNWISFEEFWKFWSSEENQNGGRRQKFHP
jgi:hypothetical protein